MAHQIFNTTNTLNTIVIPNPSDNITLSGRGAGYPDQYPSGLNIMEVTSGTIKQTTRGLPDRLPLNRESDMMVTTNEFAGLMEKHRDIYWKDPNPVPKPTAYHLPTNTELLMEMNTYDDGVRKHQVPEDQQHRRRVVLHTYKDMLERSESVRHSNPHYAEQLAMEANEYIMSHDPQLYQSLMAERNHHPVDRHHQAPAPSVVQEPVERKEEPMARLHDGLLEQIQQVRGALSPVDDRQLPPAVRRQGEEIIENAMSMMDELAHVRERRASLREEKFELPYADPLRNVRRGSEPSPRTGASLRSGYPRRFSAPDEIAFDPVRDEIEIREPSSGFARPPPPSVAQMRDPMVFPFLVQDRVRRGMEQNQQELADFNNNINAGGMREEKEEKEEKEPEEEARGVVQLTPELREEIAQRFMVRFNRNRNLANDNPIGLEQIPELSNIQFNEDGGAVRTEPLDPAEANRILNGLPQSFGRMIGTKLTPDLHRRLAVIFLESERIPPTARNIAVVTDGTTRNMTRPDTIIASFGRQLRQFLSFFEGQD